MRRCSNSHFFCVSFSGHVEPFVVAKVQPGVHKITVKLYNCLGPYGNSALLLKDNAGDDVFVSITRSDFALKEGKN